MSKSLFAAAAAMFIVHVGVAGAEDSAAAVRSGQVYRACAACHSLQPGVHLTGPSLANMWGRKAATVGDYGRYTQALQNADVVWDENSLQAWVAAPQTMVPGTNMTFRGIAQPETRLDLIAFLRQALAPGGAAKVVKNGLIPQELADGQIPPDLSAPDPKERITGMRHCRDAYHITLATGAEFPFWETNVRIKTDSSVRGPKAGMPVLIRSGMAGDRISVVFSSLAELNRFVVEKC